MSATECYPVKDSPTWSGFLTGTLQGAMRYRRRLGLLACVVGAAGTLSGVLAPVAGASPEQDFTLRSTYLRIRVWPAPFGLPVVPEV